MSAGPQGTGRGGGTETDEFIVKREQKAMLKATQAYEDNFNKMGMGFNQVGNNIIFDKKLFQTQKPSGKSVKLYEKDGIVGVDIVFGFNNNNEWPSISNFRFVQTITTNKPKSVDGVPLGSPYVDPQPATDFMPFYYDSHELSKYQNYLGYEVYFEDHPRRTKTKGLIWMAELSVVGKDGNGVYLPVMTITYGFEVDKNGVLQLHSIERQPRASRYQYNVLKYKWIR